MSELTQHMRDIEVDRAAEKLLHRAADHIEALEGCLRDIPAILDDVLLSYHEAFRNEWRKRAHDKVREARALLESQ